MKKLKSIGFAALYFVIPVVLQFLLGIMLMMQMYVYHFVHGRGSINPQEVLEKFESNQFNIILVALLNLILILGYGSWYVLIRLRRDRTEVPFRTILSPKSLWYTAGLAICGQFICNIIMIIYSVILPETYNDYVKLAEGLDINVLPAWMMIFIVAVWSPLAEELVFRAMIFRTLRKGFLFPAAAIISGVLFGAYHMNWVQGVYAAVLGILLAFVYEKTNSLLGCYLLHFFFNLFSYGISFLQELTIIPEVVLGLVFLVMHAVAVVGIIVLVRRFPRLYPQSVTGYRQDEPDRAEAEEFHHDEEMEMFGDSTLQK